MNRQRLSNVTLVLMVLSLAACQARAPEPGETRVDPQEIEQVWVPEGSFLMGDG